VRFALARRIVPVPTLAQSRSPGDLDIREPKLPRSLPYSLGENLHTNILFARRGLRPGRLCSGFMRSKCSCARIEPIYLATGRLCRSFR
jgi:hypothetical protein